ncbi:MAG: PQQ-binding-like beta-propeller repeat protein [Chitinispirillaceae bacterium]|nr:PQQ-binding-like beta-propeller repeat protein [Chitinispirillaceae bacterium]
MKRSFMRICSAGVLLSSGLLSTYAATPAWTCATEGEVLWQHTAAMGYLVASTRTGLAGIDAEKGTVAWQNKVFAGMNEEGLTEIAGTPYFMAISKGETAIIDGFTGVTVFSARAEGFTAITNRYPMYQCGGLLVTGKKGGANAAVMTNMKDGTKRWELAGSDYVFAAFEIDANSVLVVTALNIFRLEAATGKEIWKKASSKEAASLDNMGALGGLLKGMANKMAEKQQPVNAMDLYVKPEIDAFFIAVETKNEIQTRRADGKTEITYENENSYNGYKLSDGSILWPKPFEIKGKLAKVMLSDEGLILINAGESIMPGSGMMNMSGSKPVKYPQVKIHLLGYRDGKPVWGKNGSGLKLRGEATMVFKNERGIVCVTDNAVNILDPRSGTLQFEKDVKVFSDIKDVRVLSCGLFICSDEKANILDLASKELLWDKPVKTAPGLYDVKDNAVYIYSTKEKIVFKADLSAKGALTSLGSGEIEFEGKEKPKKLEIRPNGILLCSDQNLRLIAEDGKVVYKAYFPAPRDPGILRALNYANAVRAAYYGARYGMASAQLTAAAEKTDDAGGKVLLGAFGEMTGQVSNAAFSAAGEAFKKASGRYKATEQTQDYMFVLTKTDAGCSLLKVAKNDGKAVESIDLGSDKKPVYSVDGVMGRIYYRPGPKTIVCYAL